MTRDEPSAANGKWKWRRFEYWLVLWFTSILGVIPMMGMVLMGVAVGSAVGSASVMYTFTAAGILFYIVFLGVRAWEFHAMPMRIGHTGRLVGLEFRRGDSITFPLDDVESVRLARYASGWYMEIERSDGERFISGPDADDRFGLDLIHAYVAHHESHGMGRATLRSEKGWYPRRVHSASKI